MRYSVLLLTGVTILMATACRTNESPEAQVNDAEITTQVKSKLASDVGLSTVTNISVNATNGVVTLSGQVDTADVKAKAEAAARSVPKVVKVINNLQVASSAVLPGASAAGTIARCAASTA
jgi:hyperosmotically inducible protein